MSSIKVTPAFISKYTKDKYVQPITASLIKEHKKMLIHSDGIFPDELIGERRPNESKETKEYREKIYEPQTVAPFSKILNSLGKIRKSEDWSIRYGDSSKKVSEEETLKAYCEENYPFFGSVTNWMFTLCLKEYLVDPNGVIAVMPLNPNVNENEYIQPYSVIFNSEQILDWKENDYSVLLAKEKHEYYEANEKQYGKIIYTITDKDIWVSKEINLKGDFKTELYYTHNLGFLPCRKIRAVFKEQKNDYVIYKSRLSSCLPSWNEAVREYSDIQASIVSHLFPTMVMHTNQVCSKCKGVGKYTQKDGKLSDCKSCNSKGYIPSSPYQNIEVRPQKANELPLPSPIAYYIDKDTEIIKIQDERIDNHIYKGYASVNFEFLAVQLNQSGVAKELDRGELNSFIYDIAEDLISIMDDVYYYINEYRYNVILSKDEREKQLPEINVPAKYDIVSETYLIDEITKAKTNKINPFIINELEQEYANKKFITSPDVRDSIKASIELDPLSGLSEDDKMVRASNGVIRKEDYIISTYITSFIRRAIDENKDFLRLPYKEKLDKLRAYAKELDLTEIKPDDGGKSE